MEKQWFDAQNRKLQEKRRDEETKAILNEWAEARAKIECEILRKKEHMDVGTNFEKARGFVRQNWKSKNFQPGEDPTKYDSSSDESIADEEKKDKMFDEYGDPLSPSPYGKSHKSQGSKKEFELKKMVNEDSCELIDITADMDNISHMLSTEGQIAQLAAIRDYNKALPKRRRGKDEMTDPATSNITATFTVKKDLKKKTLELVPHFHPVGMVDGYRPSSVSINPFSLLNRQNEIQRSASAIKISRLRKHYGGLLGPTASAATGLTLHPQGSVENIPSQQLISNPFSEDTLDQEMSLSVYSKPLQII